MGELSDAIWEFKEREHTFSVDKTGVLSYFDVYHFIEKHRESEAFTGENQHIGIFLGNSNQYVKWFCLCLAAGAVVVPINPASSEYELYNYIASCDLDTLILSQNAPVMPEEKKLKKRLRLIFAETEEEKLLGKELFWPDKAETGFLELIATSGSSGQPKRVMLTEENLVTNAKDIIRSLGYTSRERFFVLLPLCFASANTSQLIVCILLGASLYLYGGVHHPKQIWLACAESGATTMTVVPSLLQVLVRSGYTDTVRKEQGWNLRTLCYGGGITSESLREKAVLLLAPVNVVHMYGQTEASTRISHLHAEKYFEKRGSVGRGLEHIIVRVVREDGSGCLPGERGEIIVCGGNVMKGYYRDKEQTEKTLRNGWLHTGDIGYLDEEGYLFITGRLKNVIITSGINVYPEEIEHILMEEERLKQVLVYGVESEVYGEEIAVKAVLKEGAVLSTAELFAYCKERLPQFKMPHFIEFVAALETTPNGKIRRRKGEVLYGEGKRNQGVSEMSDF